MQIALFGNNGVIFGVGMTERLAYSESYAILALSVM